MLNLVAGTNPPSHPRRPRVRLSRREKGKVDETAASEGNETFMLKKHFIPLNLEVTYHLGLSHLPFSLQHITQ